MKQVKEIKVAIVESTFQKVVTDNLEKNCVKTLLQKGVLDANIEVVKVPGSLEIPLIVTKLAKQHVFDAIIALGAIHKGDTYHFEQIANECIRGCMNASWQYQVPLIYEVLAVYNMKDAIDRATRQKDNKGVEAALTALAMIQVVNSL